MDESDAESQEREGAIQHIEEAVESEEMDEVNYHLRQALQLLGVE